MKTFSTLLALCAGNSPVTGEFPSQRPMTRSFDVFSDLRLNKRLNKQSWGWWFETPSRPLWRHRKDEIHPKPPWKLLQTYSTKKTMHPVSLMKRSINPSFISRMDVVTFVTSNCRPFQWLHMNVMGSFITRNSNVFVSCKSINCQWCDHSVFLIFQMVIVACFLARID